MLRSILKCFGAKLLYGYPSYGDGDFLYREVRRDRRPTGRGVGDLTFAKQTQPRKRERPNNVPRSRRQIPIYCTGSKILKKHFQIKADESRKIRPLRFQTLRLAVVQRIKPAFSRWVPSCTAHAPFFRAVSIHRREVCNPRTEPDSLFIDVGLYQVGLDRTRQNAHCFSAISIAWGTRKINR